MLAFPSLAEFLGMVSHSAESHPSPWRLSKEWLAPCSLLSEVRGRRISSSLFLKDLGKNNALGQIYFKR
jgi:hypothetical protein